MSLEVPGITLENEGSGWNHRTSTCSIPGGQRGPHPKFRCMYLLKIYVCFFLGILDCWKGIIHHLFVS